MKYADLLNRLSSCFWTKSEFNKILREYAEAVGLDSIFIETKRHENLVSYGWSPSEGVKSHRSFTVEHGLETQCNIWSRQAIGPQIEGEVTQMIEAFLGGTLDFTQLPLYEKTVGSGNHSMCDETIRRYINEGYMVAVFMLDLDGLKKVNDKYNHDVGSAVIFEFSNLLAHQCEDRAVVIHRSGDEFFIIMPYKNVTEVLELSYAIRKEAISLQYEGIEGIPLTAAQGICLLFDDQISFQQAAALAEEAYISSRKNSAKQRDSVRIVDSRVSSPSPRGSANRDLAFVLTKCGLDSKHVFFNPYLDFISLYLSKKSETQAVQEELEDLIGWINPTNVSGMQLLSEPLQDSYQCEWAEDELAFAIFHGLCRNKAFRGKTIRLEFSKDFHYFSVSSDEIVLYRSKVKIEKGDVQSYQVRLPKDLPDGYDYRTVIFVQIGYNQLPVPQSCFHHIIRIDARFTIGGNLPDFWEAALAELIELLSERPCHVIVYGNRNHAKKFCSVLEKYEKWGSDQELYSLPFLASKTMQPVYKIEYCKECLKSHVKFINEGRQAELVLALKEIYLNSPALPDPLPNFRKEQHRFLERSLSYEPIQPSIADGCRVNTLEEAFPTVLEIIRNCESSEVRNVIRDQAGRSLKEMPNFKIVLTQPNSNDIPAYYQDSKDRKELEDYYQSIFVGKNGFFQKYLETDGQFEAVLKHITDIITDDGLKYATRRAVLVIPHKVNPADISPLGLISICISPRTIEEGVVFDFSFTWRTVEAVVGLPYSLYGSIRYAEDLLATISETIAQRYPGNLAPRLKMGSLSYMAYSLHMFLDASYSQIVRGIINEASK